MRSPAQGQTARHYPCFAADLGPLKRSRFLPRSSHSVGHPPAWKRSIDSIAEVPLTTLFITEASAEWKTHALPRNSTKSAKSPGFESFAPCGSHASAVHLAVCRIIPTTAAPGPFRPAFSRFRPCFPRCFPFGWLPFLKQTCNRRQNHSIKNPNLA